MLSEKYSDRVPDTIISEGDYLIGADGLPVDAGEDAAAQMMRICLAVKKGSFCLDPSLGSELYTLRRMTPSQRRTAVAEICTRALERLPELRYCGAEICDSDAGLRVRVFAEHDGREIEVCVTL